MSNVVDERVVSMKFDNAQFESNISQSMSTLEKLKYKLDNFKAKFDIGSVNMDGINKSIYDLNFSPLENGLALASSKFSALEQIGIGALRKIGEEIEVTGKKLVSAFTIEPVKTGFNEFELKMGSVQTIMSGTGESLETVNKYLDELNTYSDKTIYSFQDMTSNIGKFTNNGVKLETAVAAIQGISNEAALAGANAQQASHAMYNFSQALASGYVKLIDWKSIENANMATMSFKDTLIETAVALGTVSVEGDGMYKSITTDAKGKTSELFNSMKGFNDSLSAQWMTNDVLTQALSLYSTNVEEMTEAEKKEYETKLKSIGYTDEQIKKFEELGTKAFAAAQDVKTFSMMMDTLKEAAQSGWAQTWEIIVGDFEEGKTLWTYFSDIFGDLIGKSADARNEVLKAWKDLGGRDDLIKTFKNIIAIISKITSTVKKAYSEVFPKIDGKALADVTKKIENFTNKISLSMGPKLQQAKQLFKGIFQVIKSLGGVISKLFGILTPAGSTAIDIFFNLAEEIGYALQDLSYFIDTSTLLEFVIDSIHAILSKVYSIAKYLFQLGKDGFGYIIPLIEIAKDKIKEFIDTFSFEGAVESMKTFFKNMYDNGVYFVEGFALGIKEGVKRVWEAAKELANKALEAIQERLGIASPARETFKLGEFTVEGFVNGIVEGAKKLYAKVRTVASNVLSIISDVLHNGKITKMIPTDMLNVVSGFVKSLFEAFTFLTSGWLISATHYLSYAQILIGDFAKSIVNGFGKLANIDVSGATKVIDVITNSLAKSVENLNKFIGNFNTNIIYVFDEVKEAFTNFKIGDNVTKGFSALTNMFRNLGNFTFEGLVLGLSDGIKSVWNAAKTIALTVIRAIEETLDIHSPSIKAEWDGEMTVKGFIVGMIKAVGNLVKNVVNTISNIFGVVSGTISKYSSQLINNLPKLLGIGVLTAVIIALVKKPLSFLDNISDALSTFIVGFNGTLKTLIVNTKSVLKTFIKARKELWKAKKFEAIGQMLLKLAISLAILTAAVIALAFVPYDNLKHGVIIFASFTAVIGAFIFAMSKLGIIDVGKVCGIMLSLGISVLFLVKGFEKALNIVNALNTEDAWIKVLEAAGIIIAMVAILTGVIIAIDRLTKYDTNFKSTAIMFVAIAFSMSSLVKAFNKIDIDGFEDAIVKLIGMFTVVGAAIFMLFVLDKTALTFGQCAGLIAMALGIKLFVSICESIGNKSAEEIKNLFKGFIVVFAIVGLIMLLIEQTAKDAMGAGAAFAGMAAFIIAAGLIIKLLGELPGEVIAKGSFAVLGIAVIFGVFMYVMKELLRRSQPKEVKKFISMVGSLMLAIAALGAVVALLGYIPKDQLIRGLVATGFLSLFLSGIIAVLALFTSKIGDGETKIKELSSFLKSVAIVIAVLGIVAAVMSMFDFFSLLTSFGFITLIFVAIGEMMKDASKLDFDAWKNLLAIAGIMVAVGGSLALMAGVTKDWYSLAAAGVAMAGVIFTLSQCMKPLTKLTANKDAWLSIAMIAAVLAAVGGSLALMAMQDWNSILAAGAAMAGVLFVLSKTINSLKKIPKDATGTLLAMALSLAILGASLSILASFNLSIGQYLAIGGAFAIALVGLAAAMYVVGKAGKSLGEAASGVAAFGGALFAVTGSIALLLVSIAAVIAAIAALVYVWKEFFSLVANRGKEIAAGIATIIGATGAGIETLSGIIAKSITDIATAISNGLIILSQGIASFQTSLHDFINSTAEALGEGFITFALSITSGIPLVVDAVMDMLRQVSDTLEQNVDVFEKIGENITAGLMNGFVGGFAGIIKSALGIGKDMTEAICEVLGIHSPSTLWEWIGLMSDKGLLQGLQNGSITIEEAAKEMGYDSAGEFLKAFKKSAEESGVSFLIPKDMTAEKLNSQNFMEMITGFANNQGLLEGSHFDQYAEMMGYLKKGEFNKLGIDINSDNLEDIIKQFTGIESGIDEINSKSINLDVNTKGAEQSVSKLDKIVNEVIQGKWGNGKSRWDKLAQAGYNWAEVQNEVNKRLGSSVRHSLEEGKKALATVQKAADTAKKATEEVKKWDTSTNLRERGFEDSATEGYRTRNDKDLKKRGYSSSMDNYQEKGGKNLSDRGYSSTTENYKVDPVEKQLEAAREKYANDLKKAVDGTTESVKTLNEEEKKVSENTITTTVDDTSVVKTKDEVDSLTSTQEVTVNVDPASEAEVKQVKADVDSMPEEKDINVTAQADQAKQAVDSFSSSLTVMSESVDVEIAKTKESFTRFFTSIQSTINKYTPSLASTLKNSFGMAVTQTTNNLSGEGTISKFRNIGKQMGNGIINGLKSKEKELRETATRIAKASSTAAEKALGIRSPSRVWKQIGIYSDEGFINGLKNGLKGVKDASTNIANESTKAISEGMNFDLDYQATEKSMNDFKNSMLQISNSLNNGDFQPTISPVFDITDAQLKSQQLNNMLNSYNKAGRLSMRIDSMNNQSKANDNLATRLDILSSKFDMLSNQLANQNPTPVNVDVTLQGDSKKFFTAMREENNKYKRTTGKVAF